MIKAVVFDIGNVLMKEENEKTIFELEKKFNLDRERFRISRKKYLNKSLKIKDEPFWFEKKVAKWLKVNEKEFVTFWYSLIKKNHRVNKRVLNIIKNLKKKGYSLFTLTDVNYSYEQIRNNFKIYTLFDKNFKSTDLKLIKSKKRIYNILLKNLNLNPKEIVFIDDTKNNLEIAKTFGIQTILFKNSIQLRRDLVKLGVKIK